MNENFQERVEKAEDKNLVLIEIGVGYNTPAIIKFPFEQMTLRNKKTQLIRINKDYAIVSDKIKNKTILFDENVEKIIKELK